MIKLPELDGAVAQSSAVGETVEAPPDDRLRTMLFEDEEKFVKFVKYVFEQFGGRGLELTDAPIATSLRVRPWLLARLPPELTATMRPVTDADVEQALARYGGPDILAVDDFERFPFVGLRPHHQTQEQ